LLDKHYGVFAAGLLSGTKSVENTNFAARSGKVGTFFTPFLLAFCAAVIYCAMHQNHTTVTL
jgi:hypothetical protein